MSTCQRKGAIFVLYWTWKCFIFTDCTLYVVVLIISLNIFNKSFWKLNRSVWIDDWGSISPYLYLETWHVCPQRGKPCDENSTCASANLIYCHFISKCSLRGFSAHLSRLLLSRGLLSRSDFSTPVTSKLLHHTSSVIRLHLTPALPTLTSILK